MIRNPLKANNSDIPFLNSSPTITVKSLNLYWLVQWVESRQTILSEKVLKSLAWKWLQVQMYLWVDWFVGHQLPVACTTALGTGSHFVALVQFYQQKWHHYCVDADWNHAIFRQSWWVMKCLLHACLFLEFISIMTFPQIRTNGYRQHGDLPRR